MGLDLLSGCRFADFNRNDNVTTDKPIAQQ